MRRGDTTDVVAALVGRSGATTVVTAEDVTPRARRREVMLRSTLAAVGVRLDTTPGVTIVPPDVVRTGSGTPYQVFTPYWRAWRDAPRRAEAPVPGPITRPDGLDPGAIPSRAELVTGSPSAELIGGGEGPARARLDAWIAGDLADYDQGHDDPAGDRTSHLSADLHFGCLSPLEVAERCGGRPGGDAFVRQLCWRDFHHQALFHQPGIAWSDWRPRPWPLQIDDRALQAWRDGRTGIPIVDAGMRQLLAEGWMHNRLRMIVATVLTKHLLIPWQEGARHFLTWLVDADVANNAANWQWVAGRGADTRPNRLMNPIRQAHKLDPVGPVRPPPRARTGRPRRPPHPRALAARPPRTGRARLPRPDRRPDRRRRPVPPDRRGRPGAEPDPVPGAGGPPPSGERRRCGPGLGRGRDRLQHAGEHDGVERHDRPPVQAAEQAVGVIAGPLGQLGPGPVGHDRPFEPALARHPHLGSEPQQMGRVDHLGPEGVDGVTDP